jgi:hypothetical protein
MTFEAVIDGETLTIRDEPPVQLRYTMNARAVFEDPTQWDATELFKHLYSAARIELSTIPLYLYAGYSIKGQSYSEWSAGRGPVDDFRTIVIEEMLHLCLVRNIIVAIGYGEFIRFYDERFIPTYPSPMLSRFPPLTLELAPLSYTLVNNVFMGVEKPQTVTHELPPAHEYLTLGQFYDSLLKGFDIVNDADPNLFHDTHADLQYGTAYWNEGGGGGPIVIAQQIWQNYLLYPIGAVHKAIGIIVDQGEGILRKGEGQGDDQMCKRTVSTAPAYASTGLIEYTHYAKFCRIASGLEPIGINLDAGGYPKVLDLKDAVWPVLVNPTLDDMDGEARDLAEFFNAAYCYVLALIDELYKTSSSDVIKNTHSKRYGLERTFISAMGGMLFPIADQLVRIPCGKLGSTDHAGPPFGFYRFEPGPLKCQLMKLCDRSVKAYPSLGGDNSVQWIIGLLPDIDYQPIIPTLPAE